MPVNPKSLDNLIAWKPGQSGNPSGKPRGACSPAEYLRMMQSPEYTVPVLRKISRSAKEPVGKRVAANQILSMLVDANDDLDERIEARRVRQEVNDRLEGTPTQSHRVVDEAVPDVIQVVENLRAELVGGDRARLEAPKAGEDVATEKPTHVDGEDIPKV